MKHTVSKWLVMLLCIPFVIACDSEELAAYEEAEISAVQFYYRWASDIKDPITGEPVVKEQRLDTSNKVDQTKATIEVTVTVPDAKGDFNETIRSQVSAGKLWGQVTVSTAARITPIEGSAPLGTPDNWSQERKFRVTAANGKNKDWTIKIVQFRK